MKDYVKKKKSEGYSSRCLQAKGEEKRIGKRGKKGSVKPRKVDYRNNTEGDSMRRRKLGDAAEEFEGRGGRRAGESPEKKED